MRSGGWPAGDSEERQSFLLELSDALRPLADPLAVQEVASRLLGEHLGVDRAAYAELKADNEIMAVARDWTSQARRRWPASTE